MILNFFIFKINILEIFIMVILKYIFSSRCVLVKCIYTQYHDMLNLETNKNHFKIVQRIERSIQKRKS